MAVKYKKQSDGRWHTSVWDGTYKDNKKHYKQITSSKSSKDLERKVHAFEESVKNRTLLAKSSDTFFVYSVQWFLRFKSDKALNTQQMYQNIIDNYFCLEPNVKLENFSVIHAYRILQAADGKKPTQKKIIMAMKQVIEEAVREKRYAPNDMDDLFNALPKIRHKPTEKRPLTENEKKAVFAAELDEMDKVFLFLIFGCGLRKEEALALTLFDFNFRQKTVTVSVNKAYALANTKEVDKETKTPRGVRTVPVPSVFAPTVKAYIESLTQPYLFTKRNGDRITKSSYDKMWRRILKALNAVSEEPIEGLTAHIFRHNYCTELCYQIPRISIKKIAQLLGDSEAVVINVYNHIQMEREDAAGAVDAAFYKSETEPDTVNKM